MTDLVGETNHIENNEDAVPHVEEIKRPRGRPKKEKPPQEPTEPKKRGRPSKNKPPKERKARGRPRIYEVGTILKPVDPDYFKKYYENVIKEKRNARRLVPLDE